MPPIGDDALTSALPRKAENAFFVAPQAAFGAATLTGLQALHHTNYAPTRQQDPEAAREYGGATVGANIDPSDPDFGDVTTQATLQTNLCLNEIGFALAYLLGAPVSTDETGGVYKHIFKSGSAALPIATIIEEDREGGTVLDSAAITSLALAIAQGGGKQICDFNLIGRELDRETTANINSGTATAPPARIFVPKKAWTVSLDSVNVGRLLSASLNYANDMQTDRYGDGTDTIGDLYVGDPTCTTAVSLRYASEAQRAIFDDYETPKALSMVGRASATHSITLTQPRVFLPKTFPTDDDKLKQLSLNATAAKDDTAGAALTVTLLNSVASY